MKERRTLETVLEDVELDTPILTMKDLMGLCEYKIEVYKHHYLKREGGLRYPQCDGCNGYEKKCPGYFPNLCRKKDV